MLFPLIVSATEKALNRLPSELQQTFTESIPEFDQQLKLALGMSDFIADSLVQDPALVEWLKHHYDDTTHQDHYRQILREQLAQSRDENDLLRRLRRFRRQEMVWIGWKDIQQNWSLVESLSHLSKLAEALIMEAYQWLYQHCCQQWGTPKNQQGGPLPMLILGMGKLGGGELNFSSDIDLIFTYPENGETQGSRRSISHAQFFTRLGQRLIKALDQQTFDGFCYRVDMRLRPFGESGPLVMSFAALEDYYQEQGREWERYAMIKARVMGDETQYAYQELQSMLRPFVFRRYIDFSAIQSLRRMKSMISSEVRRRKLDNNIKLGAGGIREIEFIAQSFQLIRGGREPTLRGRSLLSTLDAVEKLHLLAPLQVEQLKAAYCYLRRLENLLQGIDDKQSQTLPDNELNQQRLAQGMNETGWKGLRDKVQYHMDAVHQVFETIIGSEDEDDNHHYDVIYNEIWQLAEQPDLLQNALSEPPLLITSQQSVEQLATLIFDFYLELIKRTVGHRGREVLNRLMPMLLSQVLPREDHCQLLSQLIKLVTNIATRTTYLELLTEHPAALSQLVKLCSASEMIASQLTRFPVLLDELLDPNQLYNPISPTEYSRLLTEFLTRIPEDDMEQQMEGVRQFKQIQLLRIAAADTVGALSLMKVSDHLTLLAEAIISAVINQAWYQMKFKYGEPSYLQSLREGDEGSNRGFAVIGYGKVGGWELGYGSDLDLVFLHNCPSQDQTDGKKSIDSKQFYLRLAQRIIHLFSTRTNSGILYEVDMRLRPSGSSGLLVSTMDAFSEYQQQEAWTWEHQALVRARVVYGNQQLTEQFAAIRHQILSRQRENGALQQQVIEMREKMRGHLDSSHEGEFHLKQGVGGITDIEFLTQYLVLNYSHQYPDLTQWQDNIRILDAVAKCNLLDKADVNQLQESYCLLRDKIHHLNLRGVKAVVQEPEFELQRQSISKLWLSWLQSKK
ncbi:bifunctional [glutamate--ammonia ligase]-adenylyl-L-tyrosine phosphorylase/[glutamate--ammonia-ligase] adenylyltransferase [Vibrio sp. SS-MA-C1-2]|nr:bifunctional [glutamate--ammonia ligase]-adenylyl-L-tyrosine phosphorylase/[glutamate--ammonia-ligase] adenylyltransferase [Vibrio sp. SS-MA-C1-2]UJF19107.1 bifunctional [glutamate--ammonia ligase]-adenylyl-L-tyrosine phosphorylase/[glutamate--ammonia-ligase] adenylyltransferase [Vibrio sp. SS-MA-C1-2]